MLKLSRFKFARFKLIRHRLDLQAKISLILVGVILPIFLIVTVAENKLTRPLLEEEMRQIGINSAKTLAAEIMSARLLFAANPSAAIESRIQELLYAQPNILRVDVIIRDPQTGQIRTVASNIEEDPGVPLPVFPIVEAVTSEYRTDVDGTGSWELAVPIESRSRDPRGPRRLWGSVHVVVAMKLVEQLLSTIWKTTVSAAILSVITLILVLSYLLRKTIFNERQLRRAEDENLKLLDQLHEAERQLMNTEKLAVMGQLTASFAHEIGTPLNAIGGHLQLLREEIQVVPSQPRQEMNERLEIVNGQLSKIEGIVKGFLQSTVKPNSQRQLVDLNTLIDRTLGIVKPRIDSMGVIVGRDFDRALGPVRVVPLDLEQVFLNLMNNSLDSLRAKQQLKPRDRLTLEVHTAQDQEAGRQWAVIRVEDSGEGIRKVDLKEVFKPFFTTKRPGEGTGLGLTICRQIAHKYGGTLEIDSREGAWTRVTLRFPYQTDV